MLVRLWNNLYLLKADLSLYVLIKNKTVAAKMKTPAIIALLVDTAYKNHVILESAFVKMPIENKWASK
jgi:hypothetical protein